MENKKKITSAYNIFIKGKITIITFQEQENFLKKNQSLFVNADTKRIFALLPKTIS